VERFIGGRVMAHPRQDVELHTVYNFVPGCQRESAGIRVREYGPGGVAAARPALDPLCAIVRCRDIIVNCNNA
jgi:hypothetical protein